MKYSMKPKHNQLFHSLAGLVLVTTMTDPQGIFAMTTGMVTDNLTVANQTISNPPFPNVGDGNGDGILDIQQSNVVTLLDQVLGNYITLAVNPDCIIVDSYTDLAEFQPTHDDTHWYPQGLLYFDLQCRQAQVTLYFHGIPELLPQMEFRKYGTTIPGDFNTLHWYTLPDVTFQQVQIGGQPVVTASYVLTDGQPGDMTGVDGHIVDPTGIGVDNDFDNVISLLAKSYEASTLEGTATITVTRTGLVGALTADYATGDGTGLAGQDYVATTGTLSWADGERGDKTFAVTIPSTATVGRTFTVTLSNLTTTGTGNDTLGINNAIVTLTDQPVTTTTTSKTAPVDNYLGFAARDFNVTVKEGVATITVNRDGTLGALSIDYSTINGSALSGTDYPFTKGTLSWAEGERGDKTFTVPLLSTATVGRAFNLLLSNLKVPTIQGKNTVLNIDTATVTLTDTDVVTPPTASTIDPQQVDNFISFVSRNFTATRKAEEATITVNRDGTKGTLLVNYTTVSGSAIGNQDYQPVVSTLSWADGERGDKTFTVKLFNTATVGSSLTVKLTGVTAINALTTINSSLMIDTASVLITDADPPPVAGTTPEVVEEVVEEVVNFVAHGYTALKSLGTATITVNRLSNLGAVSASYTTQDGTAIVDQDYQLANGTLTWAEGDNSQKTFTVTLLPTAKGGNSLSLLLLTAPLPDGTGGGKMLDAAVLSIVDDTQLPPDTGETTTPPPTTAGETFQPATGLGSGTLPAEETPGQQLVPETIENVWDAGGQTYYQPVVVGPDGSLSNAVFAGDVENHGLIGNSTLLPGATLTGGDLTGTINNQGTIKDVDFLGTSLNGGTLAGNITNSSKVGGAITNVSLAPGTTLQGGKLGGTVTAAPDSLIKNVTLLPGTTINGGTLAGNVTGDPNSPATITNATITPGTQLSNVILLPPVVVPEDVVLGPGVVLPEPSNTLPNQMETLNAEILSQLSPEILSTLTPAQLQEIPPEAFSGLSAEQLAALTPEVLAVLSPEQLAEIPPEALAELSPEQLAAISPEAMTAMTEEQLAMIPPPTMAAMTAPQMATLSRDALAGLTPPQFFFLPPTSVSGLTAQNMGGLSTAVVSQFTRVHVAALNPQEFQKQAATDMGKLFNNFDPALVSVENVTALVPPTWTLNPTTGALTPPAGTTLVFKEFSGAENLSAQITLPAGLPDLNTNFGVGGQGDKTIEDELHATLDMVDLSQFMMSQDEQGILQIRGTGDYEGVNFAFVPDSNEMVQVDQEVPVGLTVEEGGFYTMTTPDSKQFKITPSTKDPVGLSNVLEGGAVILGKRGDTFMEIPDGMRAPGEAREVAMFDPLIEPAPDEFCEEIAGKTVCDFEDAPADQQPGLRRIPANGSRTREVPGKKMVYADGTSQVIHPTFLSPDTVQEIGTGLDGVERVTFNANGSFVVVHEGKKYLVTPTFGTKSRSLAPAEEIEPSLALTGGDHITYTITLDRPATTATGTRQTRAGEAREVLEMDSLIEPVADGCEEIKGEIICDGDTGDGGTELPEATVP